MRELRSVRSDFETRGSGQPTRFPAAGRVVRMAFSVGGILDVPLELYSDALAAFDRVGSDSYAEERRYTSDEVAILAELFDEVRVRLGAAIDRNGLPQGPDGERIRREALKPITLDDGVEDEDRVFELTDDGTIGTVHPRLLVPTFLDQLANLVGFLRRAAANKYEVAVLG